MVDRGGVLRRIRGSRRGRNQPPGPTAPPAGQQSRPGARGTADPRGVGRLLRLPVRCGKFGARHVRPVRCGRHRVVRPAARPGVAAGADPASGTACGVGPDRGGLAAGVEHLGGCRWDARRRVRGGVRRRRQPAPRGAGQRLPTLLHPGVLSAVPAGHPPQRLGGSPSPSCCSPRPRCCSGPTRCPCRTGSGSPARRTASRRSSTTPPTRLPTGPVVGTARASGRTTRWPRSTWPATRRSGRPRRREHRTGRCGPARRRCGRCLPRRTGWRRTRHRSRSRTWTRRGCCAPAPRRPGRGPRPVAGCPACRPR